jgi:hypothetical protein
MWLLSQGVSSAPMGERCQSPVLGEAETNNAISGARMRRRCCRGLAHVRDPRVEALGESEVFQDPSAWGLG